MTARRAPAPPGPLEGLAETFESLADTNERERQARKEGTFEDGAAFGRMQAYRNAAAWLRDMIARGW